VALDTTALLNSMVTAGQTLGGTIWQNMQTYAVPELQKIATQIVSIEQSMLQNPPPYTVQGAQALLNMQITATVGVIVAMTTLTLLAVQAAINSILAAVKTMVNTAVKFTLIA
jgi:hypothetical protein